MWTFLVAKIKKKIFLIEAVKTQTPFKNPESLFRDLELKKNIEDSGIQTISIFKALYKTQYRILKVSRKRKQKNQKIKK